MFYAITVSNDIVTGAHESAKEITEDTFKGTRFEGHTVISTSSAARIRADVPLKFYDEDWNMKPLSVLVTEGLVAVPEGSVLDGEAIREMTPRERIDAGLDNAPDPEVAAHAQAVAEIESRMSRLMYELSSSDYKVIKSYEYALVGLGVPYDIASLHEERQAARDEINKLKKGSLKNLNM